MLAQLGAIAFGSCENLLEMSFFVRELPHDHRKHVLVAPTKPQACENKREPGDLIFQLLLFDTGMHTLARDDKDYSVEKLGSELWSSSRLF